MDTKTASQLVDGDAFLKDGDLYEVVAVISRTPHFVNLIASVGCSERGSVRVERRFKAEQVLEMAP